MMDIGTISVAYEGLKVAKTAITGLADLKIETDSLMKINNAVQKVGEAQDTLFNLREELFRLQEENKHLKEAINEKDEWNRRLANYELVESEGGAVVYKSKEGTPHFVCPSCLERKEIHPLQDKRVYSGTYGCPGCEKSFPVKPVPRLGPQRRVISNGIV